MKAIWEKKSQEEIKEIVFKALALNVNYKEQHILGVPASYLDDKVFYQDASFVKDAPFISTLVQNPNHIGCHTLGKSESFFKGTQAIERELIEICASEILKGEAGEHDGYVASGGTEANLQAIWIYRNYFMRVFKASMEEICILCSSDSHYSMHKAANILCVSCIKIEVDAKDRSCSAEEIQKAIAKAKQQGKKYFAVVVNMMTTMFGSVDDVDRFQKVLDEEGCNYKIHVDGAYGGFYYPFASESSKLNFANPAINSVTLDAHKMAQAPYGTGIFLIRKGFMLYANTDAAKYVEGEDYTLIGSRSGANAVAVWMILMKNGPFGWREKVFILQKRTEWLCEELDKLQVNYYRHPASNIITLNAEQIRAEIAHEFGLVPDNHENPKWYKIVLMEHVNVEKLLPLVEAIKSNS